MRTIYFIQFITLLALLHSKSICRRDCIVINRLRIGHSRLTHSYVLSNDDVPLCESCRLPLTIKHILMECPSLQDIREKYFMVSSVKELFDSVNNERVLLVLLQKLNFIISCDVCYFSFILV